MLSLSLRGRGRPRKEIDATHTAYLISIGFSWKSVASLQGCSTKTVRRRATESGLHKYDAITDSSLDDLIRDVLSRFPASGEVMLRGHLRNQKVIMLKDNNPIFKIDLNIQALIFER